MIGPEVTFVNDAVLKYKIKKFLEKELQRYGFSDVDIQKTPVVTRIAIRLLNPSRVAGRRSWKLSFVTDMLKTEYGIENPQITVLPVANPSMDPMIISRKAVKSIELGHRIRGVLHKLVHEVMSAGATGIEINASGKIVGKGGRSKTLRVFAGYVPKAGDIVYSLSSALQVAYPKAGAIGVKVVIVPPDIIIPGKEQKNVKEIAQQSRKKIEVDKTITEEVKEEEKDEVAPIEDADDPVTVDADVPADVEEAKPVEKAKPETAPKKPAAKKKKTAK